MGCRTWTTAAPMLMGCALASVAVGCAAGDDSKPAHVATDASSKTALESPARVSAAPAEAPKQQARRRHAGPNSDAATARKASRNGKTDVAALLGLGGRKTTGPPPDAQDPRALLEALKGKRRSQQSPPGSDSALSSAVERLLDGGGRPP